MTSRYLDRRKEKPTGSALVLAMLVALFVSGCGGALGGDADLTSHTYFELVDWHVSGLWVINCPVAWVRVRNYNSVPIKEITFQYNTFDFDGTPLDQGTYTLDDGVRANSVQNFFELYLGLVNLHTDKLSVKLLSVKRG